MCYKFPMGVQIYLLDHRTAILNIGGYRHTIGILRRSWKVTEVDDGRATEIEFAQRRLRSHDNPKAVLIADVTEMPLAGEAEYIVSSHLVLGWDTDRFEVTDFEWDYLPVLGYAVREPQADEYILYDVFENKLSKSTAEIAKENGLLTQTGEIARFGQPTITQCKSITPFMTNYVKADCILSDGRNAEILTAYSALPPQADWYAGKRPDDVLHY